MGEPLRSTLIPRFTMILYSTLTKQSDIMVGLVSENERHG